MALLAVAPVTSTTTTGIVAVLMGRSLGPPAATASGEPPPVLAGAGQRGGDTKSDDMDAFDAGGAVTLAVEAVTAAATAGVYVGRASPRPRVVKARGTTVCGATMSLRRPEYELGGFMRTR